MAPPIEWVGRGPIEAMTESKIIELLDRWETSWEQGQRLEVDDLCSDCPELAVVVGRRIKALQSTAWMDRQVGDGTVTWTTDGAKRLAHELNLPPTLGRYRLDRRIGIGGFGQVWLGFDPELHRQVAIKVARPDRVGSDAQTQKFLSEARKVARLRHTNIVPIHDFGREQQLCYIVSEYLSGGDLSQRISKGSLSPEQAAVIVADLCAGLEHAHEEGFVHRDIKPANILPDEAGRPALTDFGIAVTTEELRDHSAGGGGTLYYMSPEQLADRKEGATPIDQRCDIYSLGVVLVELITGKRPFDAVHPLQLRDKILRGESMFAEGQIETMPAEVERICRKCLAVDPASRYPSARHLALDLKNWLSPPLPAAPDQSWWRHVLTASVVAVILMMCVFAIDRYNRWREQASATKDWGSPAQQRLAAEIVLRNFGGVRLEGREGRIFDVEDLPKDSFGITEVSLVDRPVPDEHLSYLADAPSVRSLNLTGSGATDAASTYIARLRRLRDLRLGSTKITDATFTQLNVLAALEELYVSNTIIGDIALIHISKLPNLQHLDCSRTQITDTGLAAVADIPGLNYLEFNGTKTTDKGLFHVARIAGLRRLACAETGVTDEGLKYLVGHKSLRQLLLNGNKITAAGIKLLAEIPLLDNLDLDEVPLNAECVDSLMKLKSLRRVSLKDCGLNESQIAALRKALPKCEITF